MTTITPDSVWAVILAAGTSSRLGQPKQLLDLGGEPVLNHILRAAARSPLGGMILVLGHEAQAIGSAVGDFGQIPVFNPDFAEGQSTSLRAGIAALPATASAALILLGDQPLITTALIGQVIDRYVEGGRTDRFVQTRHGDIPAPPVLIGRDWFGALSGISGDQGARSLIKESGVELAIEINMTTCLYDIDTWSDYTLIREEYRRIMTKESTER